MKWRVMVLAGACFSLGLSGCALQNYPVDMQTSLSDYNAGQLKKAAQDLPSPSHNDKNLINLETGRLLQLSGQYQASAAVFDQVIQSLATQTQAPDKMINSALSASMLATSDMPYLPYYPSYFETIWLFNYQALNYLALGQVDKAATLVDEASQLQGIAADRYQTQMQSVRANLSLVPIVLKSHDLPPQAQAMSSYARGLPASWLSPFSDYFAGLLYQASKDMSSASQAFLAASHNAPENRAIQMAQLKLLVLQNNIEQANTLASSWHLSVPKPTDVSLVIVFEEGNIALKDAAAASPTWYAAGWTLPFPYYPTPLPGPQALALSMNGKPSGQTQALAVNSRAAVKSLAEQYPYLQLLLTYTVNYQITQEQITSHASIGDAAETVAMDDAFIVSAADLRSWLTLPDNVQVMQLELPAGDYNLLLSSGLIKQSVPLSLKSGQSQMLWVTQLGQTLNIQNFAF